MEDDSGSRAIGEGAGESRQSYRTSIVNEEGRNSEQEGTKGSRKYVLPALTLTAPRRRCSLSRNRTMATFIGLAWQPATGSYLHVLCSSKTASGNNFALEKKDCGARL